MNEMFDALKSNLEKRGYIVSEFEKGEDAVKYLCDEIQNTTVGFGGSVSLNELDLQNKLSKNNKIYTHWNVSDKQDADKARKDASNTDVYMCSVNGLSMNGEIINIDGTGNRVASTIYGHNRVYFVVGKNKIAKDYEAALYRARNIAAPKNAMRMHRNTPCAINGDKCYDCNSPERICHALSVFWVAPRNGRYEVVLIDEELGY